MWLCERTARGVVLLEHLDKLPIETRFGEQTCSEREHPWLTVFRDHRHSEQPFPDISEMDAIVFCELYDPEERTLTYVGSLHIAKSRRSLDLIARLADMAAVPVGIGFDVYVEEGDLSVRHLSNFYASVVDVNNLRRTSRPSRWSLSADRGCFWISSCRASERFDGQDVSEETV